MNRLVRSLCCWLAVSAGCAFLPGGVARAENQLAFCVKSLLVAPAHGPSIVVAVQNRSAHPYQGDLTIEPPAGWRLEPVRQDVSIPAGETREIRFLVKSGFNREDNRYPVVVAATNADGKTTHAQTIAVASAPYFKPEIDGNTDDWSDAIPLQWVACGKKTTVSTYWNRKQFSLLVAVEEDRLVKPDNPGQEFDAVQFAIAASDSVTGSDPSGEATRFEYLLVATSDNGPGRCYRLAAPGTRLNDTKTEHSLTEVVAVDDAQLIVRREANTTYYECSLPWGEMRGAISPGEGREFCFSILVHDPDGTGVRDWGDGAGLWSTQRNALAWSRWLGAKWPDHAAFDNKIPWGMCSSKY